MSLKSRQKSARAQREVTQKCRQSDCSAVLSGIHMEIRRTERLRLEQAMTQAIQNRHGLLPAVVHRANRATWKITMELDDFFTLCHRLSPDAPIPSDTKHAETP